MRDKLTLKTSVLLLIVLLICSASMGQTANFTAATTSGCSPLVVSFQNQSTNASSYTWDFGNGATSTLENPSTTYFNPGTYTVKLTATNPGGSNTMTRTALITVYGKPAVKFQVNDSVACFPHHAQFTDQSTAASLTNNSTWLWDFGDGTQGTAQNPVHVYQQAGTFTVTLKLTNDKGCYGVATKQKYISIAEGIASDFTNTFPTVCRPPFNVSFNNTTTGPGTLKWHWDFGDGDTSNLKNPAHTYTKPGNFVVTMAVTSSVGCQDTLRKEGTLNIADVKTSFNISDSICINSRPTFINTSSPLPATSEWYFGDGDTSHAVSPTHNYPNVGSYRVTLYNNYGFCRDSAFKQIKTLPRPSAEFSAPVVTKCSPSLTVNFQDKSANAVSWQWDFGDQSPPSNSRNPSHTYTSYGKFAVRLVVTNSSGCTDTMFKKDFIEVVRPDINIRNLPTSGCLPLEFTPSLNLISVDPAASYIWNFGDGSPTTTESNPTHIYTVQGIYDVTVTITTTGGCTETKRFPAVIKAGERPVVNFSATPNPACAFQPVTFTDLTDKADSWFWVFGDGTASSTQNPSHEFSDTGTLDVKLFVLNVGCLDSLVKPKYIRINAPIAKFGYSTTCDNRKRFYFTDSSIIDPVGPTTWTWNFGDGTPESNEQEPEHIFPDFGIYQVSLTVSSGSCAHTVTKTVRVIREVPQIFGLDTICKSNSNLFQAGGTNPNLISYEWDFGDGGAAIETTNFTAHYYGAAGDYPITLIITDIYNCRDTLTNTFSLRVNGPTADFDASGLNGCIGLTPQFNDKSQSDGVNALVKWTWDFGDSTTTVFNAPPFTHSYNKPGDFDVKLVVTDAKGCTDQKIVPNYIHTSNPKAQFTSIDTLTCPGSTVAFSNRTAGSTYQSFWNFGDGSTSTTTDGLHQYAADGDYPVTLKITDPNGCSDSTTSPLHVKVNSPKARFVMSDSISSCTPFEVDFTNNSTYYFSSTWDLGGGTSTLKDPIQFYNAPGKYPIRLYAMSPGGCVDTAYGTVQVFDTIGSRIAYAPLDGCKPLPISLEAFSPGPMTYTWDFGDGILTDDSVTTINHVYYSFGNFIPKVIMTDQAGCIIPVAGRDTIVIKGATAKFGLDTRFFCDSGMVRFTDSTKFNDSLTGYQWDFGDGATSNLQHPVHFYNAPGIYDVSVFVQTQNACVDTFRIPAALKIVQSPLISITGDTVICVNDDLLNSGVFDRPDTSNVRWLWQFPNGNTANVQLPPAQKYGVAGQHIITAVATNSSGCKDTATKRIFVNPLPVITMPSTITMQAGFPVTVPASYSSNVISYNWTPPATLNCTDCPQPVASPKFNTRYTVSVVDSNGCRNNSDVEVIVICKNANIFIPNTFSPNDDGTNDVFYVRGKGLDRVKSLRIFNRWGEVVFEQSNFPVNNPLFGWNGRYKGKSPVADVYVYQVEIFCENSQIIRFDGNVALIQ